MIRHILLVSFRRLHLLTATLMLLYHFDLFPAQIKFKKKGKRCFKLSNVRLFVEINKYYGQQQQTKILIEIMKTNVKDSSRITTF